MAGITALKRTGYLHGGVTHPDGRRGFFAGAEKDSREKGTNISPGTVGGGPNKGDFRDFDTSPKDNLSHSDYNPNIPNPDWRQPKPPTLPKKKPPKTKDNYKTNFVYDYFSKSIPTTVFNNLSKSKFVTNLNAKRRKKYINDLLETDPDEYNRIMGDLSKINMIVGPQGVTTQVPPSMGFTQTDYGMPKAPPGMLTSDFEVIDGRHSLGDPAALEILGQKYKDTLTFDDNGGEGGDGLPLPYPYPINYNTGAAEPIEEEEKTFDYRFGNDQKVGADVTRASYIFNQGGRVPRAFGGIMDTATGRRAYGLGSVFKSITKPFKSVAKAAGKVLKSDFGKMALAAGAFYYGGGGANVFNKGGGNWLSGLGKMGSHFMSKKNPLLFTGGNLSLGKLGLASAALPFLMPEAKQDTMPGGSERGGHLLDSKGNEALPADLRKEVRDAYESGDDEKIKAIQDYYNFLPGKNAVRLPDITPYLPYPNYADGGRIGFRYGKNYKKATSDNDELLKRAQMLVETGYAFDLKEAMNLLMPSFRKSEPSSSKPLQFSEEMIADMKSRVHPSQIKDSAFNITAPNIDPKFTIPMPEGWENARANGGRIKAQEGGLMNLGGMEKDYRNEGGFVPIGKEEKADDVPARLSVNEFVFTADAVRNAGGGDIDKGAEVMENVMKNLENGGRISEETQGNTGAQEMFSVSERIGEVI